MVCADIPYAFSWYAQYQRILFWDEFGHPDTYLTRLGATARFGNTGTIADDMILNWWWDPERIKATEEARAAGGSSKQGPIEVRPWASANGGAPTG